MTKRLVLIVVCCFLLGCGPREQSSRVRHHVVISVETIEHEGREYVVFQSGHGLQVVPKE